jgi:hypothetical protein
MLDVAHSDTTMTGFAQAHEIAEVEPEAWTIPDGADMMHLIRYRDATGLTALFAQRLQRQLEASASAPSRIVAPAR